MSIFESNIKDVTELEGKRLEVYSPWGTLIDKGVVTGIEGKGFYFDSDRGFETGYSLGDGIKVKIVGDAE